MCLHLFFIQFYLLFLFPSHLISSLPLLVSVISVIVPHLMRCGLKRREVCNTWRLELSFMRLGCCPALFFASCGGWGWLLCANANGALKNLPTKREAPNGFGGEGGLIRALIVLGCGRKRCATIKLNSPSESKYIKSTSYQTFLTHLAIKLIKPKFE